MTLYKMALRPSSDFGRVTVDEIVVDLDKFICAEPREQGQVVSVTFGGDRAFRLDETGWADLKEALGRVSRRGFNQLGRPEPVPDPVRTVRDARSTTGDIAMRMFEEVSAAQERALQVAIMPPRFPTESEISACATAVGTMTFAAGDSGEPAEARS